jgi:hypothetical protein
MTFTRSESGLRLELQSSGPFAQVAPRVDPMVMDVLPVRDNVFVATPEQDTAYTPLVFFTLDGRDYVHFGARATPRVA